MSAHLNEQAFRPRPLTESELNEFWSALMRAHGDMFITMDEAIAAYRAASAEAESKDHPEG